MNCLPNLEELFASSNRIQRIDSLAKCKKVYLFLNFSLILVNLVFQIYLSVTLMHCILFACLTSTFFLELQQFVLFYVWLVSNVCEIIVVAIHLLQLLSPNWQYQNTEIWSSLWWKYFLKFLSICVCKFALKSYFVNVSLLLIFSICYICFRKSFFFLNMPLLSQIWAVWHTEGKICLFAANKLKCVFSDSCGKLIFRSICWQICRGCLECSR